MLGEDPLKVVLCSEFLRSKEFGSPTLGLINIWKKMIEHRLKNVHLTEEAMEDAGSTAMFYLLQSWDRYSNNPFSYYCTIVHEAIVSHLAYENRIKTSLPVKDKSLRTRLGIKTLNKDEVIKSLLRRMKKGENSDLLLRRTTCAETHKSSSLCSREQSSSTQKSLYCVGQKDCHFQN